MLILLSLFLFPAGGTARAGQAFPSARVRVGKANVRRAPDKTSRKLFSLRRGARVKIVRESGDWLRIVDKRGRKGWLFSPLVRRLAPSRARPEIELVSDSLPPSGKKIFARLIGRLRQELAGPEKRHLLLEVTRLSEAAPEESRSPVTWMLALKVPFRRAEYRQKLGRKLEPGVVDLLPFQNDLKGLLNLRDRFLTLIDDDRTAWSAGKTKEVLVETLLILESPAGDQVILSGRREHGLPVFNAFMLLNIHGFSQFSLSASLPGSVTDFSLFVLPPARLADGRRSPAALAYDFFGLSC